MIEVNDQSNEENDKVNVLSQYVQLNLSAFQQLRNKNYKLAMSNFEKCIDIAKDLDDMKHVESLTNYAICQFFCGNFEEAYDFLEKAKEISSRLYDNSNSDKQIQLLDSLSKYYERNQNILENNLGDDVWTNESAQTKMVNKCLFGLHKSLRENDFKYWFNCLSEEVSKSQLTKDSSSFVFLLINQMAACYCCRGKVNDNLKSTLTNLVKYYQDQYNKELKFKEKNINNILSDFKARIKVAVEIYKRIWELENELTNSLNNQSTSNIPSGNGNKYLVKILFKHAINYLNKPENKNDEIKNQIELALRLIENDEIDCSMINIMNINNEITKSLKILIENLSIIFKKVIIKKYLLKFKLNTLNYVNMYEHMQNKYILSKKYLEQKLEMLDKGYELSKFNFNSKGIVRHVYQISKVNGKYHLIIYKTLQEQINNKSMKTINLDEMMKISFCCMSDNLKKRIMQRQIKDFKPWRFLSLHFPKRTIDLYFDSEELVNEWFLGLFYYMKNIRSDVNENCLPKINEFFMNKLKLKLLYELKDMKGDLQILEHIKTFASENELEYQALPISKTILLYVKVKEKLGGGIGNQGNGVDNNNNNMVNIN